jgi:hypothetical protein
MMASQSPVGKVGSVIQAVRGGDLPGEVRLAIGGFMHYYIAYAQSPIPSGADVLIINNRGARSVDVEPWPHQPTDTDDARRKPEGS